MLTQDELDKFTASEAEAAERERYIRQQADAARREAERAQRGVVTSLPLGNLLGAMEPMVLGFLGGVILSILFW